MTKATTTDRCTTVILLAALAPALLLACSNDKVAIGEQKHDGATDGVVATGDAAQTATGGAVASGGAVGTGGRTASGGAVGTGGAASGGVTASGGIAAGGIITTGGVIASGGILTGGIASGGIATGGRVSTGGVASGGAPGTGGAGTGGSRADAATDAPMSLDAATDAGKTCGGLAGIACAAGELCDLPTGSCQTADMFGTCKTKPQVCSTVYQPVCGCDGKVYSNDCSRLLAGVAKQNDGECIVTSLPCPQLTTRAACDARGDCHSVFVDPNDCNCPLAGCCARYSRCATGGRANCDAEGTQIACAMPIPYCAGDYTVSYTSVCYDGCVLKTACAATDAGLADTGAVPPTCPAAAPTQGAACGSSSLSCFYDRCPANGRTQATCSGGTWSVQTGACGSFTCAGYPDPTFTCASGKICIVSAGGAIGASCADNGCGTGAVSEQCITGAAGCSMTASTTGGVTFTCNTCPQGGCP